MKRKDSGVKKAKSGAPSGGKLLMGRYSAGDSSSASPLSRKSSASPLSKKSSAKPLSKKASIQKDDDKVQVDSHVPNA